MTPAVAGPRIGVIACGALAVHVRAIARRRGWHVDLHPVPALLHNRPERIAPAVRAQVEALRPRYDVLACAYADCGTYGALDAALAGTGVERLSGDHCYDLFARDEVHAALEEEPGTYFLTDFLARTTVCSNVRALARAGRHAREPPRGRARRGPDRPAARGTGRGRRRARAVAGAARRGHRAPAGLKPPAIGSRSWWRRDAHHDRGRRSRRRGGSQLQPPGLATASGDGPVPSDGLKVWELTAPIASLAVVLLVFVLVQTYSSWAAAGRAETDEASATLLLSARPTS